MRARAIDLRRTQELFWALIAAPEGAGAAAEEVKRSGLPDPADVFAGDGRLSAIERVDIYANMYFYRLLDALREDYPRVEAAIGGRRFHNLVTDYLLRHPSENPSLRHLGRPLPGFIRSHPIGIESPYLADLAALEWARVEAFDAPDAAPVTREDLARLPVERAGEARPGLIPAFAMERFGYDVVRLWRELRDSGDRDEAGSGTEGNAAREGEDRVAPGRGPRRLEPQEIVVRVWRSDFVVYHKRIGGEEARCLELARDGASLERICQSLAAGRSAGRATDLAGRILQGWIDDGLVAALTLPGA